MLQAIFKYQSAGAIGRFGRCTFHSGAFRFTYTTKGFILIVGIKLQVNRTVILSLNLSLQK
jgi:hypothetical protein